MSCIACVVSLALIVVWWIALKLRLVPKAICQLYCTASIFCLVCTTGVACFLIDLLRVCGIAKRQQTNDWCALACAIIFRSVFFTNPQISVHIDESEVKWDSIPNRICLLCNHTSFMDALIVTAFCPVHFIVIARTLMKSSLRQLPIFGGVFDRVGHFPVYFKSDEAGNFGVDKERQAAVNVRVKEHIKRNGRLTIFPEGQMNKTPEKLLPFRNGTFQTVVENNMEMYYCALWGCDGIWHSSSSVPSGGPGDIYIKLGRIGFAKEGEDSAALSARCQQILQGEVSNLQRRASAPSSKSE